MGEIQLGEPDENALGTGRKKERKPFPPLERKKDWTPHEYTLSAQDFYFQNCLSPFFTWANSRGTSCGYGRGT